jgi:hypothetical protein
VLLSILKFWNNYLINSSLIKTTKNKIIICIVLSHYCINHKNNESCDFLLLENIVDVIKISDNFKHQSTLNQL